MPQALTFEMGFILYAKIEEDNPPLYKPSFWKDQDEFYMAKIGEVATHLDEIIHYYESLIQQLTAEGAKRIREEIWIRPGIFYQDEVLFAFPRYDKFSDAQRFGASLLDNEEPSVFFDADQGRVFHIVQDAEYFYFIESADEKLDLELADFLDKFSQTDQQIIIEPDPENPEWILHTRAKAKKSEFISEMDQKLSLTQNIIEQLTKHFGVDYWSQYQ